MSQWEIRVFIRALRAYRARRKGQQFFFVMGDKLEFARYLGSVEELLNDLGVPGVFSSPAEVRKIEELYDEGAPLEVVLRGIMLGAERKIKKGGEVRGVRDLMRTINAEIGRVAFRGGA